VIDVKVEELFTLFVDKVSITGSSSTSENSLSGWLGSSCINCDLYVLLFGNRCTMSRRLPREIEKKNGTPDEYFCLCDYTLRCFCMDGNYGY
jgi:hypothetical protein